MNPFNQIAVVLCLGLVAAFLAPTGAGATVMIYGNDVTSFANDGSHTNNVKVSSNSTGVPTNQPVKASDGAASSETDIAFSAPDASTTLFSYSLNHQRPGTAGAVAGSSNDMFFTVDVLSTYTLSGSYTANDPGWTAANPIPVGIVWLTSDLGERSSFGSLNDANHYSQSTPNESFTLGGMGGDSSGYSAGSLTGLLLPSTPYIWLWSASIEANRIGDGGATATGNITLTIRASDPKTIPEPGTLVMFGVGLAGLGMVRRKTRRA